MVAQTVKKSTGNAGDLGLILGLGRSPRGRHGNQLQCSCLENPYGQSMVATGHRVVKHQTRPSDFTFTFHFPVLEKEMATHSSILAWEILWMEKPGRPQFIGSQ